MQTYNDVHRQFAELFPQRETWPYAYLLSRHLAEGNICLDFPLSASRQLELSEEYRKILAESSARAPLPGIATTTEDNQPFIVCKGKIYIQRYFRYESSILESIRRISTGAPGAQVQREEFLNLNQDFISSLFAGRDGSSNDLQVQAASLAFRKNFSIITGGPGTGKTTTVARVLQMLLKYDPALKIALAAPTGKAAARMSDSLSHAGFASYLEPKTIHRLLGTRVNSPYFKFNRTNPLPYDLLIIDEASMIDIALFAKLLEAVKTGGRLILLGDKNQLSSVEAGSLFADLCTSLQALTSDSGATNLLAGNIVELKQSHRFSSERGIGRFSAAVLENNIREIARYCETKQDQVSVIQQDRKTALEDFCLHYQAYIQEPDIEKALEKFNQYRILCALKEKEWGVHDINRRIEQILRQKGLVTLTDEFYENRPIMLGRNYHSLGLFNGDTGIIRKDDTGAARVWFPGETNKARSVLAGLVSDAETAYAMTIHKSQGSEYRHVMVVLPEHTESRILSRELLYTAITRAREQVTLLASASVLLAASSLQVTRASGLTGRINEQVQVPD